ncbi:anti-sigma factor [Leptolyngbya cf. ectocarpi LEGE 11479]|uniref:Regulator of SigK n=1 Tax=Leptolyngbya cf. ectocarpi LEGE 11479 TaxID=1828722 RepID=A0A929F995_LEPEC|nr:anti-sigma factor [Leptolyngbya ectocarpi]MBE9067449.1 anti-sigma factor [Leptolyngbya cf. ectocarpi LEGE 11479]
MASERKLDELAADYVAGTLSDEEADEFARLVVTNPELQAEVSRLEKTIGLVLGEFPLMEPPPRLRDAVLMGIDSPVSSSTERPNVRSRSSSLVWILGALAAGATALSGILGLNNHRLRLANQQLQNDLVAAMPAQQAQLILQQPDTRFYDFEGTDRAADSFGSMIVDTQGLEAAIAFKNLPPLATDQTYALWVNYQGQYIPCGNIQPGQDGTVFATLPMPPVYQSRPWVKDVIVTVEPADLPAQPTGPIVAETI